MWYSVAMNFKLNAFAAHLTATFSALTTLLVILHPGFHLSIVPQAVVGSIGIIVSGVIEMYHLLIHHQFKAAVAVAAATASQVNANITPPVESSPAIVKINAPTAAEAAAASGTPAS